MNLVVLCALMGASKFQQPEQGYEKVMSIIDACPDWNDSSNRQRIAFIIASKKIASLPMETLSLAVGTLTNRLIPNKPEYLDYLKKAGISPSSHNPVDEQRRDELMSRTLVDRFKLVILERLMFDVHGSLQMDRFGLRTPGSVSVLWPISRTSSGELESIYPPVDMVQSGPIYNPALELAFFSKTFRRFSPGEIAWSAR